MSSLILSYKSLLVSSGRLSGTFTKWAQKAFLKRAEYMIEPMIAASAEILSDF